MLQIKLEASYDTCSNCYTGTFHYQGPWVQRLCAKLDVNKVRKNISNWSSIVTRSNNFLVRSTSVVDGIPLQPLLLPCFIGCLLRRPLTFEAALKIFKVCAVQHCLQRIGGVL